MNEQRVGLARPNRPVVVPPDVDAHRRWARDVARTLDRLDARSAAVLRMVYLGRATYAQAAVRLGIPVDEISAIAAAALRRFAVSMFPTDLDRAEHLA